MVDFQGQPTRTYTDRGVFCQRGVPTGLVSLAEKSHRFPLLLGPVFKNKLTRTLRRAQSSKESKGTSTKMPSGHGEKRASVLVS